MRDAQRGIFGIDLGTTYSVVSYIDETGRPAIVRNTYGQETTPSVVYFENESNVVVGQAAKEAAGQDPENVVSLIKRHMGDKDFRQTFHGKEHTPASISAIILDALAKSAAEGTGCAVKDVVITVPAYFGLLEKDATRTAGEIAGLNVIGIVPEPVAAALQYGITGSAAGRTVLVYDLGGGTFDVSIMRIGDDRIEVLVVGGNHKLGGADWDQRLLAHVVNEATQQFGDDALAEDEAMLQDLRLQVEKVKQSLSVKETATFQVRYTGTPAKVTISRTQFEDMTRDLLDDTVRITESTLEDAEAKYPGITSQISDVLLVGGSSYMPAVSTALEERFGWQPRLSDPNLTVAKGAALYAAGQTVKYWEPDQQAPSTSPDALVAPEVTEAKVAAVAALVNVPEEQLRELAGRSVVNVLPKAIGVKLADVTKPGWEDGDGDYVEHLVDANTQLPVQDVVFNAATVINGQDSIAIELWEQAGARASQDLADNIPLDSGSGTINGLGRLNLHAGSPVNLRLDVTDEGTVQLRAVEPRSGQELNLSVRISVLSAEEVQQAKRTHSRIQVST